MSANNAPELGFIVRTTGVGNERPGTVAGQLAVACFLGTGLLGFLCLASAYKWELEQQFICSEDNCVVDRRGWIDAHPLPSVSCALFASIGFVLVVVWLVQRRRG